MVKILLKMVPSSSGNNFEFFYLKKHDNSVRIPITQPTVQLTGFTDLKSESEFQGFEKHQRNTEFI